jgi:hypothetical protein
MVSMDIFGQYLNEIDRFRNFWKPRGNFPKPLKLFLRKWRIDGVQPRYSERRFQLIVTFSRAGAKSSILRVRAPAHPI